MEIEKICQYLNEIGILEYENINIFLKIYSSLNEKKYSSEINRIIDTLKIYLNNNFIKNNQISKLCESIIFSYNNYQLISKYQSLNNMNNILLSKLRMVYIKFFLNLSLYLLKTDSGNKKIKKNNIGKKSKSKINKYDKYADDNTNKEEENIELISSDDERECTFTPQINKNFKGYKKNNVNNNIESQVYYSPIFNIASKYPINKYQNNIYSNQSFTDNNMNNYSYSNLNISNDNRSNMSYNQYGNNYNQFQDQPYNKEYNMNYNNRNYYNVNNINNHKIIHSNYDNPNLIMNNQYFNNNKYNYSNISDNNERNAELFFNKELYHLEKVKNKIDNLKKEKYIKIAEECTFKPKINTNYKSFYPEKEIKEKNILTIQAKNKNNLESIKVEEKKEKIKKDKRKRAQSEKKKKFKILEDLSLAKKKRTDKTKKLMKERNFTPKITKNNKYKITMSFEDRRLKSIELRNKIKNAKKSDNDNNNIANNVDNVLAPGEMVRFKENNFINNNNQINNIENEYLKQNNMENNNDTPNNNDKINLENNNKEENDEKIEDNLKDLKDNNIINNNNDFKEEINDNNENEIRQNNQNLINKLKEEHKIGFKAKKNEENKEPKVTEESNEQDNKNELDLNSKKNEFSFNSFHMRSKSLKDLFKKSDE